MIDIIIINYNCASYLQDLLEALITRESTVLSRRTDFTITVVDNASTDGSASLVETQYPSVNIITNDTNLGYAAAVNIGLSSTKNDVILLLNSDVLMKPGQVASLIRIWERLDYPGILGPLHLEEDEFPQLTWGTYPTTQAEAKRRELDLALANREPWAKQKALSECCNTREVDWVSGSCMLFARATAEEIGPWDQNFFLYFEDIDWCLRAKTKGYSVYHTSETHITHAHGASMDKDPEGAEIEYRLSQTYFARKHLGRWMLFKLRWYLTFKMLGRMIIGGRSGFERATSYQILKDVWRKITV